MSSTHWWWIRHAPSAGLSGTVHGQDYVDADLSDKSAIQNRIELLPKNAVWLTSGLPRADQTARALGGNEYRIISGLMELDFGEWNGKNWNDLRAD